MSLCAIFEKGELTLSLQCEVCHGTQMPLPIDS